jgi:hypothetical protein
MHRALATAVAAALLTPLLGACGGGHDRSGCTTGPPDVLALADVPFGGGGEPSQAERAGEVRFEATHPDVFSGAIFGDGHDYVGFTADAGRYLAELRREVPDPDVVRSYCAEYSNRQLVQLQRRISADNKDLLGQGIQVNTIAVDERTSRVDITILHLDPQVEHVLRDRYGPALGAVVQGEAVQLRRVRLRREAVRSSPEVRSSAR